MMPLPVFGPPPPSPTPPDSSVGSSDSFFATQFPLRLSSCLDAPSPTLSAPRTVISARNRAILPFTKPATRPTAWQLARDPLPRAHARVSIAQLLSAATLPPVSHGGGAGTAEGALLLLGRRAVLRVEVVGVVEGGWVSGDRATYNVKDSSGGVIKCHCWLPAHPTAGGPGASAPASSAPKGVGFAVSPQESLLRTVRSAAAALAASSAAPTPEAFLGQGGLYPSDDRAGLTALSAPAPAPVFPPLGLATAAGPLRALKRGALTRIRGVVKVWAGEPEVHVTHMCGVGSAGDGDDSDDDNDDDCSSGFGFLERDFVSSAPPQESSRRRSSGSESTSDALLSSPPARTHACEAEALGGVALTCPLPPVPATTASTAPSETQEGQAGGSQGVDAIIESLARAVADRLEAEHAAETRKVWVKLRAAAAAADTAAVQAAAAAAAARKATGKATDSSDAPADKVSDTTTDKAVRLPQNGTISRGTARMSSARSHLFALVLSATPLCVTMPALCADPAIIAAARAAAEALTRLSTGVSHTHASKGDLGARLALQRALSVLVTKGALSRAAPMWVPVPARAGLGERVGKLWEMAKNAENAASVGAGAGAETEGKAGGSMYGRRRSAPTGPVSGLKKAAAGPPVDSPAAAAAAAVAGSESHSPQGGSFGQLSRLKKLGYLSTVAATLASASAAPVATAATSPAAPVDAAESSSPSSQQQPPQQSSQQQSPQQQQQRRPPVRVRPPPDCLWVLTPGGHMVPRVLGMLREKAAAAAGAKAAADGAKAAAAEAKAAAAAVVEAAAEAEAAAAVAAAKAAALDAAAAELASVPAEEAVLFAASTAPAPAAASAATAAAATGAGVGAEGGAAAAAAVVVGAGGLRRRRAREAVRLLIRAGVIALVAHTPIGVAGDGGDEKDDGDGMALAQTRVRWREPAEGGGTIVIPVEK